MEILAIIANALDLIHKEILMKNAYDAPFLSAMIKDLNKYGHLTYGQREKTKQMILKYSKQLVKMANSRKYNKEVGITIGADE